MSKTTHYELNTPIGSEVLSVMTGLNPNFTAIDGVMYDNETRSTQALNKANVNEQNIATALGRITTAEGDIDTLESGLETANTNISGLTSRMTTAENGLVSANNRIQENTNSISTINNTLSDIATTNCVEIASGVKGKVIKILNKGILNVDLENATIPTNHVVLSVPSGFIPRNGQHIVGDISRAGVTSEIELGISNEGSIIINATPNSGYYGSLTFIYDM
jgi:hypothetical protein